MQEARELCFQNEINVLELPPSSLCFYRDWVAPNRPLIIKNALGHWRALSKWTNDYLRDQIGGKEVTVSVTPNGYADSVVGDRFVMPEERRMKFVDFLDIMRHPTRHSGVFYIQKQNSNFSEEFKELLSDAELHIPWVTDALGRWPDAVNMWMGDSRAVTSMHKDHYENIYCVVKGEKQFILHPPTDAPFIPYDWYLQGRYKEVGGKFDIISEPGEKVPWICIDPLSDLSSSHRLYKVVKPIVCTVRAGEMLYLPSLWFHHVRQSHACIAVNFWYDMDYDVKYNYFQFVSKLSQLWQLQHK
ncbi:bifunctional peptidase and (3S)-lysyl hydroxylase Jmjd7-like [Corticium candelabrum]|uniref:bifunctional peptidase and (3S)-lysyl hydroxylase Jmjd7-like n=1 Tax=Corticium candelabrum TaxID=121492 RepID=UPI002E268598|nr:bifunctional peptidase and (3S)-lysyl hydroxylase Jmjd7-like [Corticium candelabrum]